MAETPGRPNVLVIGGPNGAGKSTVAERLLREDVRLLNFVNADTIARGLSLYDPESVALQAGKLMLARIEELRSVRADFSFETTLSGRGHARFMAQLRADGYWVELLYVTLQSAEQSVERVAHRVAKGGHSIPPDDIRRRFLRSRQNLVRLYMPLADRWSIWDNTGNEPRPIAVGHRTDATEVFDMEFFNAIRHDAQRADH